MRCVIKIYRSDISSRIRKVFVTNCLARLSVLECVIKFKSDTETVKDSPWSGQAKRIITGNTIKTLQHFNKHAHTTRRNYSQELMWVSVLNIISFSGRWNTEMFVQGGSFGNYRLNFNKEGSKFEACATILWRYEKKELFFQIIYWLEMNGFTNATGTKKN